jgi:hypothetical protein
MITQNVVGPWPENFPLLPDDRVEEGLVVWSRSFTIEGRTTGSRRPCSSTNCFGWFIGVRWQTGQMMFPCSEGWEYSPSIRQVHIDDGGEISARVVSPKPLRTDPLPESEWPEREKLFTYRGWRIGQAIHQTN